MKDLKKYFPISFDRTKSLTDFIIGIVIYVIAAAIFGLLLGFASAITGWIPVVGTVVGWIIKILSIIAEVYVFVGLVLLILAFLKIIK